MQDGTVHGTTLRISQKEEAYVKMVKTLIVRSGGRAWTYREGRKRTLFVVEFSRSFLGAHQLVYRDDLIHYARGFFDAEGGIPHHAVGPRYIYFAQKGRKELFTLKRILERLGIRCGTIHRPSARADPNYWRFYVSRSSHQRFVTIVGSWHPRKAPLLRALAVGLRAR